MPISMPAKNLSRLAISSFSLSPYVHAPAKPQPVSPFRHDSIYLCESVQLTHPSFSYAAAGLQTIRKNTAAASPPHSAAVAAAFPIRSWKFSSSSFHVAQIHYCMQCVTLRHFPPFLSSSKACNRNLQPTKNSPFHPLFRFLEVKHFVW